MLLNSDFKELLRLLESYQVKYLVIGGYAVMKYAEPRYTKDLDLWIQANDENGLATFKALATFGAPLLGLTANDFASEGYFYQMGIPPVRIDILMSVKGVNFENAYEKREIVLLEDIAIPFISKSDLILSKIAAGRPQDLLDVEALQQSEE